MNVLLLALRERARRWARIQAVKLGVSCIHTLDSKAWRPAVLTEPLSSLPVAEPARLCRYCEALEVISEGSFYALFGRPFNGGRA